MGVRGERWRVWKWWGSGRGYDRGCEACGRIVVAGDGGGA